MAFIKINNVEYTDEEFQKMIDIAKMQAKIEETELVYETTLENMRAQLCVLEPNQSKVYEATQVIAFLKMAVI